jgi:hypothetical protein
MQTDLLKLVFSYGIAAFVVVAGFAYLWVNGSNDTSNTTLAIVGMMTAAMTFVFGQEFAKAATRAAQSSSASGAAITSGSTPPPPNPPTNA